MSDHDSSSSSTPNVVPDARDAATFVTVYASVAPLHGEPRVSSPQVSQRLAGHRLQVIEQDLIPAERSSGTPSRNKPAPQPQTAGTGGISSPFVGQPAFKSASGF